MGHKIEMSFLSENYHQILSRVNELREKSHLASPTLIAVSKSQSVEAIQELYQLGHRDFGENYAQELVAKDEALKGRGISDIRWHFIGHLQSNKVKALLPRIYSIHTLSSFKLAQEIVRRIPSPPPLSSSSASALLVRVASPDVVHPSALSRGPIPVFVEVNLHREEFKSGLYSEDVISFVQKISQFPELDIQGLMCVPDPQRESRAAFEALRSLELKCRPYTQGMLSMGMSSDFETALECGSTHIRLGTILFGKRGF